MRRTFTVLAAAFAVVAFSSMTFAQAPAQAEKPKPVVEKVKPAAEKTAQATAKTEKAEKKEAKKAATVATGKVAKYDAATKTLTVTTKKGDENFALTADTKIMAGAKAAKEDDLAAGKNVKVNYTEANGQMTATKVTIAAEKAATKKTEKKEAEKK